MTCMGRLDHAKVSTKALMAYPRIDGKSHHFLFVDYYCPQSSGDWVKKTYGDRATVVDIGALQPLETHNMAIFNKPLALNSGALMALANLNTQYLVFLDADTVVTPLLLDFIFYNASMDRFMIFEPDLERKDLTGFLVVHKRHFIKVNGYDRNFKGWGAEDLEIRVKLFLKGASPLSGPFGKTTLGWTEIPSCLATCIPHTDDRRMAHYKEKTKEQSHSRNLNLLCRNVFNWLGTHPSELHDSHLGPSLRRLLGMELTLNPRALE